MWRPDVSVRCLLHSLVCLIFWVTKPGAYQCLLTGQRILGGLLRHCLSAEMRHHSVCHGCQPSELVTGALYLSRLLAPQKQISACFSSWISTVRCDLVWPCLVLRIDLDFYSRLASNSANLHQPLPGVTGVPLPDLFLLFFFFFKRGKQASSGKAQH